jgi:hypothetical protein
MNVYELVFAIVLIVTIGKVIESRRGRRRSHRGTGDNQAQTNTHDPGRIEELEQRVQVLEKIVTDQGYELRQKFRDLED